jgi:hypothetical protein
VTVIVEHELGRYVELAAARTGPVLWRYVYGGKPKPFFHPICTPAGHNIALFEPHDHVWHRGLWFTIKFVNEENFWEEHAPYGVQRTLLPPDVTHDDDRVTLSSVQCWIRPDQESVVIDEQRRMTYVPLAASAYALDLVFTLTPRVDVVLDRTPFEGWGGYGGLCFRGSRNWGPTRLLFSDGSTSDRPTPVVSAWCDLSGPLDGGVDQSGGIAMFDHSDNIRHPVPWYGGTGPGHYFNAAFLFNEPLALQSGTTMTLRYRVYVHDGVPDVDHLEREYRRYVAEASS